MAEPSRAAMVAAVARRATAPGSAIDGRLVAVGWATVELDRAAVELAGELGLVPEAFLDAADSIALGARCRVAAGALDGVVALAILEPSTEGQLAQMLARRDEGPAAIWLAPGGDASVTDRPPPTAGPFGPERLLRDATADGLRRLLVSAETGTIER